MKKILAFFLPVLLLASCQKEPDMSKLDDDFVVYTDYDKSAPFSSYTTYYLPDSVLVIGQSTSPSYWTGGQAASAAIISQFESDMNSRGYLRIADKTKADLGLQISYIEDVSYFYDYDYPWWWWGYPYYWDPTYWGWWDFPSYYPYPIVYSYSIGSLIAEMVDLKTNKNVNQTGDKPQLQPIWTAYMAGLLSGSNQIDLQRAEDAIDQAFNQSSYIRK